MRTLVRINNVCKNLRSTSFTPPEDAILPRTLNLEKLLGAALAANWPLETESSAVQVRKIVQDVGNGFC